jgi:protein-S-isoprenylcysteine O-methyltransferase Ste14
MRDASFLVVLVLGMLFILAIGIAIAIFFYLTLSKCLSRIRPENRDMEPAMVWLNLIPCFHLVWIFITINRIGSSLQREFRYRRWRTESENFGVGVGTAYAVLLAVSSIPYLNTLSFVPLIVCWIIYWVQIANYSSRLASDLDEPRDDDWDEPDDYPTRKRGQGRDDDAPDDRFRDRDRDEGSPDDRIRSGDR